MGIVSSCHSSHEVEGHYAQLPMPCRCTMCTDQREYEMPHYWHLLNCHHYRRTIITGPSCWTQGNAGGIKGAMDPYVVCWSTCERRQCPQELNGVLVRQGSLAIAGKTRLAFDSSWAGYDQVAGMAVMANNRQLLNGRGPGAS